MCKEGASREELNPHMEQTHIIIYIDNSKIPYHTCILTYESEFRLWKNTRHSRHSFSVTTWYHISVPDTRASFSFLLPQLATIKMRLILIQYKHIKFNITVGLTLAPFEKGPSQPRAQRIYEIIKEKFIYINKNIDHLKSLSEVASLRRKSATDPSTATALLVTPPSSLSSLLSILSTSAGLKLQIINKRNNK